MLYSGNFCQFWSGQMESQRAMNMLNFYLAVRLNNVRYVGLRQLKVRNENSDDVLFLGLITFNFKVQN